MKKLIALVIAISLSFNGMIRADEGMWLPFLVKALNMKTMQKMGMKLTAEQIYDINNACIKDAIVALDHGSCTGELISAKGLLLTNHHCGYGEIQAHSSVENDYLTDGFWAKKLSEELPNPGKTASFLIRIEDVTEKINAVVTDEMTEDERLAAIKELVKKIETEATGDTHYEAAVESFFKGNNFYLFVYETFHDIRLVGAPPSSIGKFGGDTDNWMWPRHTGDFSLFRVYSGPDGKPAEFSEENIPVKPKHHLPISIKGVKEGDFAFIMGYPGSTDRYLTSWGVDETIEYTNKIRAKVRTKKLDLMKKDMSGSDKIRIQYASKQSRCANYWKYSIEQNKALKALDVIGQKQKYEKKLVKWIKKNKKRRAKYGEALALIKKAYKERVDYNNAMQYWMEALYSGCEVTSFALKARGLQQVLAMGDEEMIKAQAEALKAEAKAFFKDYNQATDQKIAAALFNIYKEDVAKDYHPSFFEEVEKDYKKSFEKYVSEMMKKSVFADEARFAEFIENPTAEVLEKDMAMITIKSSLNAYFGVVGKLEEINKQFNKGNRLMVAAQLEMEKGKAFYPDANSTMRLTYGKVGGYKIGSKKFTYYTTIDEYMNKEDANNPEFVVSDRMKELYKEKNYGQYADKDGVLRLCFITDNDITGGNSGSPVINGDGHLIGIAFDGNSEAMSGDIAFEDKLQKCINMDIRYTLWVIEKYAGATNLIDEMTIIK